MNRKEKIDLIISKCAQNDLMMVCSDDIFLNFVGLLKKEFESSNNRTEFLINLGESLREFLYLEYNIND